MPGLIESLLVHSALQQRIADSYCETVFRSALAERDRLGIYINYVLSERDEYAALWTGGGKGEIVVREEGDAFLRGIDEGLHVVGLDRMFKVKRLE